MLQPPTQQPADHRCPLTTAPPYEPHGFESIVFVFVLPPAHDLSVTDGVKHRLSKLCLDPAQPCATHYLLNRDDAVASDFK